MRRKQLLPLIAILAFTSGCGLVPKEEVLPQAPVIPTYAVQEYEKVSVMRGDVVESVQVRCTYKAYRTEWLRFKISGAIIDHAYVQAGDLVKTGDLLADLEMGDLTKKIEDYQDNIELLELKLSQEKETKKLAVANQEMLKSTSGYSNEIKLTYDEKIANHESTIKELSDDLYIENKRLEQAREDKKNYQLIAGIDGVVSNVQSFQEGDTSTTDSTFVALYDPNTMLFITDGTNSDKFRLGQEITVTVDEEESYQTVVVNPEDILTKEEIENQDKEKPLVYLKVKDTANTLESGELGIVEFILNERRDVLYLPSKAIYEENGKPVVYVEDEDGFKSIKEVEIGLTADQKVEIVSGLSEGDNVILE